MAAEEPEFVLIEKDGDYELRQYAPMIVAETLVQGPLEQASPAGFELIAGYIFGDNRARTGTSTATIAMTAPVTIEHDSRPIAMTAPVTMQQDAGRWRMRFFMPWGTLDLDRVLGVLVRHIGPTDKRIERLQALPG